MKSIQNIAKERDSYMISRYHPIYHLVISNITNTLPAPVMGQIFTCLMMRCSEAKHHLCNNLGKKVYPEFNHGETGKSKPGKHSAK